ncbi:hypothetical protein OHA71_48580 [Streptomyces sp. NBC_00444]|uniref:glycosyl hydrolase family 28-related protein n=1 Tax=Streptomyces sp. NBC_00444 TaxID=2975744 RepID=UPI002E1DBFBA
MGGDRVLPVRHRARPDPTLRTDHSNSRPSQRPADSPTEQRPANSPPQQPFDVRDQGAKVDGSTNDTTAINKAVTAANSAGGGTVRFPAGKYKTKNTTRNVIYMASLRGERLWRIPITSDTENVGTATAYYVGTHGRLRTVTKVPGADQLWLSTTDSDNNGDEAEGSDKIFRMSIS